MQGVAEDLPSLSEFPLRGFELCPETESTQHSRSTRGCEPVLLLAPHKSLRRLLQRAGGSPDIGRADCWSAPLQYHFLLLLCLEKLISTCMSKVVFAFQGTFEVQADFAQVVALL